MQVRFIRMIDKRLENAPHSRKAMELKEEIVQNLMEKYNDLRAEGKSEEDAFNIAAESIGDLSDLVRDLRRDEPFYDASLDGAPEYTAGAEDVEDAESEQPFLAGGEAAYAPQGPEQARHRSAMITATAVMLFILSPVPYLFFGARMGTLLLFAMIASGIGLLVYNSLTRPHREPADSGAVEAPERAPQDGEWRTVPIEKRPRNKPQKQSGSIQSAFWLLVVAVYVMVSFQYGGWHLTWVIFLFAAAAADLIRLMLDPNPKKLRGRISSALWTSTVGIYFILSFRTGAWHITWIIFLIAAALGNVLRAFLNPNGSR